LRCGSKRCALRSACMHRGTHTLLRNEFYLQTICLHRVTDWVDLLCNCRRALILQMELKSLVVCECLPAMGALEGAVQLDPGIPKSSISRFGTITNLQTLRHPSQPEAKPNCYPHATGWLRQHQQHQASKEEQPSPATELQLPR